MLRLAATLVTVAAVLAPAVAAAPPDRLPDDAIVAGVAVGGLGPIEAKRVLKDSLGPVYEQRPVAIRVNHHDTLVMPRRAGFVIYYDWMVERAFSLAGANKPVAVPMHLGVKNAARDAAIAAVASKYYRAPRNARVRFGVTAIRRVRARLGHALDRALVVRRLERELRHPTTGRVAEGRVVHVRPAITTSSLRRRYPAYISIDRPTHT